MNSRSASSLDSGVFTDLNRLAAMKGKNSASSENVKKVAQEFESLFVGEMLKSMRSASNVLADENSPFNSQTVQQFQEMYDQQMAVGISRSGKGIGLAKVLERQLGKGLGTTATTEASAATSASTSDPARTLRGRSLWPSSSDSVASSGRDDSQALNRRRLALPGSISQRLAATAENGSTAGGTSTDTGAGTSDGQAFASLRRGATAQRGSQLAASSASDTASSGSSSQNGFASKEEFIQTMLPMAQKAAERLGIDARYLVAQAALETGWGKHMVRQSDGSSANNLFGIKARGWSGDSAQANTREFVDGQAVTEKASFRAYDSYAESFHDYVDFLQDNGRYSDALGARGDSERFMRELQEAGYATDPRYANKVNQIARQIPSVYQTVAALDAPQQRS
ncbi:flagellar assembly peptidoglycan hydrolase FlgJ [Pseudomonas sp. LRF_L74]|uniref:flagellar assembly peptidoglycan hydrolase FlgJ n=1 Tax=Pseudomonas sp. LRF_L74 TaxID=3369422 RepID=UPI003F606DBC